MKLNKTYNVWVATNKDSADKILRKMARCDAVDDGTSVGTWSVQDSECNDDIFCGTYCECMKAAKRYKRNGRDIVRIALIGLDKDLASDYCFDQVDIG